MILKQVIRYTNADALEATWVTREQLPDVHVPESFGPTTRDDDGNIVPGELIPAHIVPGGIKETVVKCQAYANSQMDLLAADLGDDAPQYQALMDEVAATYVPPPPESTYVPQQVSPRQIRQAINRVPYGAGTLRQAVEAAVAAGDQDTKDWWEFATAFERTNPQVIGMGQVLGVDDAQLDALWMLADSL